MKFTVSGEELERMNKVISKIPSTRIEGFDTVMFEVKEDVNVKYSNGEVEYMQKLKANDVEEGKVALAKTSLVSILKALPKDTLVSFKLNEGYLEISTDEVKYRTRILDESDYVGLNVSEFVKEYTFSRKELIKGFEKVAFCADTSAQRTFLNGVLMDIREEETRFVASDGYMMGYFSINTGGSEMKAIFPRNMLNVFRAIPEDEIKLLFSPEGEYARMDTENMHIVVRLITEEYVDYESIFPSGNARNLRMNLRDLKEKVKALSTISPEFVKLVLSERSEIFAVGKDGSEYIAVLDATYDDEPTEVYLDYRKFASIVKHLDGEYVNLLYFDESSPVSIEDFESKYIMMPTRI